MSDRVPKILEDERTIDQIHFYDSEESSFTVGAMGVTRIVAYPETAEYALVPWIAVYKGDYLFYRVAASRVEMSYDDQKEMDL